MRIIDLIFIFLLIVSLLRGCSENINPVVALGRTVKDFKIFFDEGFRDKEAK